MALLCLGLFSLVSHLTIAYTSLPSQVKFSVLFVPLIIITVILLLLLLFVIIVVLLLLLLLFKYIIYRRMNSHQHIETLLLGRFSL